MKINPINKFFNKGNHFVPVTLLWGTTALLMGGAYPALAKDVQNREEQAKKEIQLKDPQRYERLSKLPERTIFDDDDFRWSKEARKMNDSLKMDAIIKKAYFEGAQMVRDSIANADARKQTNK